MTSEAGPPNQIPAWLCWVNGTPHIKQWRPPMGYWRLYRKWIDWMLPLLWRMPWRLQVFVHFIVILQEVYIIHSKLTNIEQEVIFQPNIPLEICTGEMVCVTVNIHLYLDYIYCLQGKFRPCLIFAIFALWPFTILETYGVTKNNPSGNFLTIYWIQTQYILLLGEQVLTIFLCIKRVRLNWNLIINDVQKCNLL